MTKEQMKTLIDNMANAHRAIEFAGAVPGVESELATELANISMYLQNKIDELEKLEH